MIFDLSSLWLIWWLLFNHLTLFIIASGLISESGESGLIWVSGFRKKRKHNLCILGKMNKKWRFPQIKSFFFVGDMIFPNGRQRWLQLRHEIKETINEELGVIFRTLPDKLFLILRGFEGLVGDQQYLECPKHAKLY